MSPGSRVWPPSGDESYRQQVVAQVGSDLAANLAEIDLLVFDADGVLTPGNLVYGPEGEALKEFHSRDGLGLVMARVAGLKLAVLTGRNSPIVARRAAELRFDTVKMGRFDKLAALGEILDETGIAAEHALYMGDDLIDVPAMHRVAVAVGVPLAPAEVREQCAYVTAAAGGAGAVREVTDLVLKASGRYGAALVRLATEAGAPTGASGQPPAERQ